MANLKKIGKSARRQKMLNWYKEPPRQKKSAIRQWKVLCIFNFKRHFLIVQKFWIETYRFYCITYAILSPVIKRWSFEHFNHARKQSKSVDFQSKSVSFKDQRFLIKGVFSNLDNQKILFGNNFCFSKFIGFAAYEPILFSSSSQFLSPIIYPPHCDGVSDLIWDLPKTPEQPNNRTSDTSKQTWL